MADQTNPELKPRAAVAPGAADTAGLADHLHLAARIDRLPITRFLIIFLLTMGTGFFFDFFDLSAISYAVPVLIKPFHMTRFEVSFLIASGYLAMVFGSPLAGYLSDRIGRKRLFTITLVTVLVGQLLQAATQNYWQLLACHLIVGLGIGGDVPIIWAYISEMLPTRVRGRWSAFAFIFGVASIPAIAFAASAVVPTGTAGWRWLFVLGAVAALVFLPVRLIITESPRFLLANGRVQEAAETMEEIEERVERDLGRHLPDPAPDLPELLPVRAPLRELFGSDLRRRTVLISIQTAATQAGFYAVTAFLPLILIAKGFSVVRSLEFSGITGIGIICGPAIGLLIWDRLERRYTLMAAMGASAILAFAFAFATSQAAVVVTGFLLFMVQQIAPLFVFTPEIFPTRARGTGAGFANAVGRLMTVISILVVGSVISGIVNQLAYVAAMFLIAVLALAFLGVNTSRRRLEAIGV